MKIPEQGPTEIKITGGIDKIIEKLPDENEFTFST